MNSEPLSESRPNSGKGRERDILCTALPTLCYSLPQTAWHSTQPVAMSNALSVLR